MIEQDLSANAEPPRTQVSRGEVSLDTSHPSLVIRAAFLLAELSTFELPGSDQAASA
jgi:hypothetical protein